MRVLFVVSVSLMFACGAQPVVADAGSSADSGVDAGSAGGGGGMTGGGGGGGMIGAGGGGGGMTTGGGGGGTTIDAGVGPVGCVSDVSSGHHSFSCDSINYEVEIPASCTSGGCGVVFDVHGATMTAATEDRSTGLRATAGALGYVVVQPTAPLVFGTRSWTPSTDDAKVWTFVGQLRTALAIDPKKIHFTGFSQGGALTWRMLCAHADVLASVAPVAAADGLTAFSDCSFSGGTPSQQIPVLQMHGTLDGLVAFSKGVQQRAAAIAAWSLVGPTTVNSDPKFSHTRYVSPLGTAFEFVEHDYVAPGSLLLVNLGGHCLPGGADLPPGGTPTTSLFFSCVPPSSFVWGQLVMAFFVAHPRN